MGNIRVLLFPKEKIWFTYVFLGSLPTTLRAQNIQFKFFFVKLQCIAFRLETHLIIGKVSMNKNPGKGNDVLEILNLAGLGSLEL